MTRADALRLGTTRLATMDTPARDARALLLNTLNIEPHHLTTDPDTLLTLEQQATYDAALARRAMHEPVSKIIGYKEFYGQSFHVNADVLDPRPETETLIDAVLDHAKQHELKASSLRILDLGTGSGCILLTLLANLPKATGLGVDMSEAALSVAKINAHRLQLSEKSAFTQSNWFEKVDERFDLVVCNPPYIGKWEAESLSRDVVGYDPAAALFADEDGLSEYRLIASALGGALSETGTAFFEIGLGQEEAVAQLFSEAGFDDITFRRDLAGIYRCMIVQRSQ